MQIPSILSLEISHRPKISCPHIIKIIVNITQLVCSAPSKKTHKKCSGCMALILMLALAPNFKILLQNLILYMAIKFLSNISGKNYLKFLFIPFPSQLHMLLTFLGQVGITSSHSFTFLVIEIKFSFLTCLLRILNSTFYVLSFLIILFSFFNS